MNTVYNDEMIVARIKSELDKVKRGDLPKTAFTISASDWNLTDGKYLAVISANDLTADKYVEVFFNDSCSEIVTAAKISTEGETFQGGISITAENLPTDSISGSYYIFKGDSFMSKARVNIGSYQESTFVGATSITSGVAGNVPAPLAGDQNKFLRGNGQWADIPSGGSTGSGDFVINGTSVKGVSISGADVSFESDTAKITISSSDNNFTDAYKTKLDSIQAGAEVNVIEGIALNGTNVSIDANKIAQLSISGGESTGGNITINGAEVETVTLTGGLNYSYDSSTKKASISGGDFSLNGDTVKGMNIGGVASVSVDTETGIADVVINSSIAAGVEAVSVLGGEINASVNNRTLYLYAPVKPTLADPQFTVPESLTAVAYTEVPVTISRNGDGYISPIAQPGMTWKRKNATEFTLKVNNPGDYLAGMTLTETANYYAAAKNIPVHVTQNDALKILLHFDDQNYLLKNSAPSPATITGSGTYNADGKFGDGCCNTLNVTTDITDFGARSFTIDFQSFVLTRFLDYSLNFYTSSQNQNQIRVEFSRCYQKTKYYIQNSTIIEGHIAPSAYINDWFHRAICYDFGAKTLYFFINGVLDLKLENCELTTRQLAPSADSYYYIDELRILDGVCQWKEDFTPPAEPY